jgi:hypothetical protein
LCRLLLPVWGYLAWYSPRWHWRLLYSFRIVQCLLLDLVAFCLHSVLWIYVSSFALSSFYPWSKLLLECIGKSFGHGQCWVVSVEWSVLSARWSVSAYVRLVQCMCDCLSTWLLDFCLVWFSSTHFADSQILKSSSGVQTSQEHPAHTTVTSQTEIDNWYT